MTSGNIKSYRSTWKKGHGKCLSLDVVIESNILVLGLSVSERTKHSLALLLRKCA
jgi:hypothetical protein